MLHRFPLLGEKRRTKAGSFLTSAYDPHNRHRAQSPRQQLHRATVEGELHSLKVWILENSRHAVVIEYFYLQMNARRHDFRGARRTKVDGVTSLFPRFDGASGGFAFDLVSDRDKAATELFGKLSKADLIAFLDEDFTALISARRPSAG